MVPSSRMHCQQVADVGCLLHCPVLGVGRGREGKEEDTGLGLSDLFGKARNCSFFPFSRACVLSVHVCMCICTCVSVYACMHGGLRLMLKNLP